MKRVAIIVLNWNGKQFLGVCMDSLLKQTYGNSYVVFVDNASTDGSADFVLKKYAKAVRKGKIRIIKNDKNYGFAEGNNIGIRFALKDKKTKYVAILNNDTEVHKDWISELVKIAEKDKRLGMVASKVLDFKNRRMVDTCGIGLYSDGLGFGIGYGEDESKYDKEEYVFGAYGAAAFYRREMLEDTKLDSDYFDSDYFVFQEELDLSWRAQLRGWKCAIAPNAKVFHIGSGTFKYISKKGKYLLERNRISTLIKNLQPELIEYCLPRIILYELISLPFYLFNGHIFVVLKGRIDGLRSYGESIRKRKYVQSRIKTSPQEMRKIMKHREYRKSILQNI
jgi:hypothetical protein